MDDILKEERFDYVSAPNKAFIRAFDDEMTRLGYDFGDKIGSGYCWGNHMIIYTKAGVKSKNVYARIYMRERDLVHRLFFNQVDNHRGYIENAPAHIREAFTGDFGMCTHERDDAHGKCMFRKTYTLEGRLIEKCNGFTFWYPNPSIEHLNDYVALFTEFFPVKGR